MNLPPIADPHRYSGLFVFDFGTHVSVGYTATEIRLLRESPRYCKGVAYQIYRVSRDGAMELRGVLDERLAAREAICFLRAAASAARKDYRDLVDAARRIPVPAAVEMALAKVKDFEPPHATALSFSETSSVAVSEWLERIDFRGGDVVIGGSDVCSAIAAASERWIDSCRLPSAIDYEDRPAELVLAVVHDPLQR